MSDARPTTRANTSTPGNQPGADAVTLAQRDGWRVDPPHQWGTADAVQPPVDAIASEFDVIQEPYAAPLLGGTMRTDDLIGDPVLQARQIADHLQLRYADLNRREQRLNIQLAELDQERRMLRIWLADCESDLQQRDLEISQRDVACSDREANCLSLEHELQARKAELLHQESELQVIQARWREEWEQERQTLQEGLDRDRLDLENEQAHFALVKEGQLADIQQERSLLVNRIRFQEEHLQKLRREFEAAQGTFHHERQRAQAALLETDSQLQRRSIQLNRRHDILEEQAAALQRRELLIEKSRCAELDGLALERQHLAAQQAEWERLRDMQHAELERKNEILQANAENLEARQNRLEQLRLELEETNRMTMEMRLSVEEACAQLAQAVGPDVARQRIESAQSALSHHYRQARESLVRHRQELQQFQQAVLQQRDEFRSEQQMMTEWIAQRDEELQFRADTFHAERAAFQEREQSWQQARERWLREKLEAEAVIRDLLGRVEQSLVERG